METGFRDKDHAQTKNVRKAGRFKPQTRHAVQHDDLESRLVKIRQLAFDIEEPLLDIASFVQALHFIGNGIAVDHGEAGEPIMIITSVMNERLNELEKLWRKMLEK